MSKKINKNKQKQREYIHETKLVLRWDRWGGVVRAILIS